MFPKQVEVQSCVGSGRGSTRIHALEPSFLPGASTRGPTPF